MMAICFLFFFGSERSLRAGLCLRLGQKEVVNVKENGRRADRAACSVVTLL